VARTLGRCLAVATTALGGARSDTAIIPIVVSPEAKTLRVAAMVAGSASLRRQLSLVEDGSWF
jgi:hypothetical protein